MPINGLNEDILGEPRSIREISNYRLPFSGEFYEDTLGELGSTQGEGILAQIANQTTYYRLSEERILEVVSKYFNYLPDYLKEQTEVKQKENDNTKILAHTSRFPSDMYSDILF